MSSSKASETKNKASKEESSVKTDDLTKELDKLSISTKKSSPSAKAVADLIQKSDKILVLTGAGVSVAAGIPDFRTPKTGLYDNLKKYNLPYAEAVFDISYYRTNPKPFVHLASEIWPSFKFQPTLTHAFIKLLDEKKKLLRNYTQNIDGLETAAGIPEDRIVECHGHFRTGRCIKCNKRVEDMEAVREKIWKREVPKCVVCDSYVKPDIVFFGEQLPPRFHQQLQPDLDVVDCCMIIGTSLQVPPVAHIPQMVGSTPRVLLNMQRVGNVGKYKGDLFHAGACDDSVLQIAHHLGWEDELLQLHENAQASGVDKRTSEAKAGP